MHAHLTPVTTTSDSRRSADLDDACPGRPALASTSAPAAVSSPAAAFSSTGRSPFSTAPAVEASSFNVVPDRRGTASLKWDFAVERGRPEGVLPLWVADMDHATAPAVTSALLWRTRHSRAEVTQGAVAWSMSATHRGRAEAGRPRSTAKSHLRLPVPVRSWTRSNRETTESAEEDVEVARAAGGGAAGRAPEGEPGVGAVARGGVAGTGERAWTEWTE